jgi:hypothetical protein
VSQAGSDDDNNQGVNTNTPTIIPVQEVKANLVRFVSCLVIINSDVASATIRTTWSIKKRD